MLKMAKVKAEATMMSCSICYDVVLPANVLSLLNCGHIFHENCMNEWKKTSKTCPQCRKKTFKSTQIYPNFTTAGLDEQTNKLLQNERDEKERYRLHIATKEVDIELMKATKDVITAIHIKEMNGLRNEIGNLKERAEDLLIEKNVTESKVMETSEKLEQSEEELSHVKIDQDWCKAMINCYEENNTQVQIRRNELDEENGHLRKKVRMLLSSLSTPRMKRAVAIDEHMNQQQTSSEKIVIDLDNESDDDCVIVTNDD